MLKLVVWIKPPWSQARRSHPGKAKRYEPKALNETMLSLRRKKSITISHTQQISTLISTKEKEWRHEKRGDPHQEQEKVNKIKKCLKTKKQNVDLRLFAFS